MRNNNKIIEGIRKFDIPNSLHNKKIYQINMGKLGVGVGAWVLGRNWQELGVCPPAEFPDTLK